MRTDEVTETLGVSETVVKTRLSRARGALRRDLSEQAGLAASNTFRFLRPRCDRVVSAVLANIAKHLQFPSDSFVCNQTNASHSIDHGLRFTIES